MLDKEKDQFSIDESRFTFDNNFKKREAEKVEKQAKFNSFLKMGRNTLVALLITAVGVGGTVAVYNLYQTRIDNKIANVESVVKNSNKEGVLGLISKEQSATQQTFAKNQLLINNFGSYKDLIEILSLGPTIAQIHANNAKLYKDTDIKLKQDNVQVSRVYSALEGSRDQKIAQFLDAGADIEKFNKWVSNFKNNQFMYVGGLVELNKDINKQLTFLEQTQNEIIKNVNDKIKSGNYDLNSALSKFYKDVDDETKEQIEDLNLAMLELHDTEQALKENGDNPNRITNLLSDEDVKKTTDALAAIRNEAFAQINSDKEKVQQLIAQANQNGGTLTTPVKVDPQPNSQPTTQVVHTGPSFLDYYLMYSFMNMGNNTSSFNNGYNQGLAAGQNRTTPVAALANSKPYSLKNESSYLNKSLNQKANNNAALRSGFGNTAKTTDLKSIKSQIESARSRVAQVRSTRQSELSRMGYSNSTKNASSKSNISASRGVKSPSSSSSISKGGSGARASVSSGG